MEFLSAGETIRVNVPDAPALERQVRARLAAGTGFALATINLDHLDKLEHDARFRAAYRAHDFVVADGNPIVWLSRLAGRPVSLVPGADLVEPLCRWAAEAGRPVALVGTTAPALAAASTRLCARLPGLKVCATIAPPMGFEAEGPTGDAVIAALREARPGLVLLALGAPRQEQLAARGRTALPEVGFASIGAGLDFVAGTQARAPRWVRALALEWLWRAATQPRRLAGRYARSLAALPRRVIAALRLRRQG